MISTAISNITCDMSMAISKNYSNRMIKEKKFSPNWIWTWKNAIYFQTIDNDSLPKLSLIIYFFFYQGSTLFVLYGNFVIYCLKIRDSGSNKMALISIALKANLELH